LHEFNCLIRIRRASALYTREYYAPEISSIEQWGERERERDSMEGTEHAEISSFPSRFFSPLPPQSRHYQKDGILDIMCHVKSSYAFRTVKLLFILGARREERKKSGGRKREGKRERKSEKQRRLAGRRNHLATSNPLRTKLPSYHRASCQDAPTIQMQTNAGVFLI